MIDEHNSETDGKKEKRNLIIDNVGHPFGSRRDFLKKGVAVSAAGLGFSVGTVAGNDETTTTTETQDNQQFVDTLNYALTLERLEVSKLVIRL